MATFGNECRGFDREKYFKEEQLSLQIAVTICFKTETLAPFIGKTVPVGDLIGDFIPVRFFQLHQKGIGEDFLSGDRVPDGHPTDHCDDPEPLRECEHLHKETCTSLCRCNVCCCSWRNRGGDDLGISSAVARCVDGGLSLSYLSIVCSGKKGREEFVMRKEGRGKLQCITVVDKFRAFASSSPPPPPSYSAFLPPPPSDKEMFT
ncbi:hypothetical protein TNCT_282921 [Trichonephila clavata]|uniref:Uncharacterized protein n=1 Tax=Trichonephila clavata TaxID=2740835 RepID=A0A8X6IZU5_TRICU|nr:hypothetical protein TNCT_282921 [Trichonephila clavata]